MIFLTNDQVAQVLDMPSCIEVMEEAYRELNEQRAGYRPRIDFYVPQEPHYYRWGTMEGASRKLGVFAIRMKSDMLAWERDGEYQTEDKYCIERGTYCGLIFLLSVRNAEPLCRSRSSTRCRSHGRPQSRQSFPEESVAANTQCSL